VIAKALAVSILLISSASASTTFTQTITIPSAPTDVFDATATFNDFGSIGAPVGSVLLSVTFEFVITETLNSLTLTNTSGTTESAKYTASANFDAGDSASAADAAALDNALFNNGGDTAAVIYTTGILSFAPGQVYPTGSFPLPKALTEDTGVLNAASLAPYAGVGTFNLDYSTLSSFTISGGGNNINATQVTTTNGTATVVYTYGPAGIPEPASLLLTGSGLLAVLIFGRKKLFRG
jgi:hypothetical protein